MGWLAVFALSAAAQASALDLQGHRGARGLAPENTLAAFERALQIGVTTLELDAGVTADGVVVIAHDSRLNPDITRDATGRWLAERGPAIRSQTWAQLQAWDVGRIDPATKYAQQFPEQQPRDGQRIPSLASLFQLVKELGANKVRFNIETKLSPLKPEETLAPEAFAAALLAVVREAGMASRVSIQSFDWRTLQWVQHLEPAIPTVYLSAQRPSFDTLKDGAWAAGLRLEQHGSLPKLVKAAGGAAWSPHFDDLTPALVKEAQDLGLQVVPWTVNRRADMERLLDWGVDGLITDHPDRLRELMRQRGLPLPRALNN